MHFFCNVVYKIQFPNHLFHVNGLQVVWGGPPSAYELSSGMFLVFLFWDWYLLRGLLGAHGRTAKEENEDMRLP